MQSAILLRQIGPSVRLSVTLWYCIETNARVIKLFPSFVRHDSSFLSATVVTKFQRKLPQPGRYMHGVVGGKSMRFWAKIAVSSSSSNHHHHLKFV